MSGVRRKLFVDGQVFQTAAWHRGMGKYSVELLAALQHNSATPWGDLRIILSKNIATEPEVVATINERIVGAQIVNLDLLPDEIGNAQVAVHNRKVVDAYIATQGAEAAEIDFLILSAMQGVIYPTFPSSPAVHKMLLFYDLIPFMFHDVYLRNTITRAEYLPRMGELLRADIYLAISKTVANDLAVYAGIEPKRIVSIDGGAIQHGTKQKAFSVPTPFILMPTGNDLRKNNRRAILGFEEFNKKHDHAFTLVVTSFFKEHEIAELSALSSKVLFTGNISGEELNYLYVHAEVLLFPPEYEGLGMPILEALEKDKPIACSNIAVFREMSETAFNYFDPYLVVEIADALEQAINQKTTDKQEYARILKKYTWHNSAQKLIEVARMIKGGWPAKELTKPRLAIFGPDPSRRVGAGKTLLTCHAELSRRYEITYFIAADPAGGVERRVNYLPYVAPVKEIIPGMAYDRMMQGIPVYHIGNGEEFASTLFTALANPGIVLLYDGNLMATWEAMLKRGFIDASRLKLEERLGDVFSMKGGLSSLLATQHAILASDKATFQQLVRLAKKLGVHTSIVPLVLPVGVEVYGDVVPLKTKESVQIDDTLYRTVPTDYRLDATIAKRKVAVFGHNVARQQVLEVMRFGVLPLLPEELRDVAGSKAITYSSEDDIGQVMQGVLHSEENWLTAAKQTQENAQKHAPAQFADTLQTIVSQLSKGQG